MDFDPSPVVSNSSAGPSTDATVTYSGGDGQPRPSANVTKGYDDRSRFSWPWTERLYSTLARVFGLRARSEGFVLQNPTHDGLDDETLTRLETRTRLQSPVGPDPRVARVARRGGRPDDPPRLAAGSNQTASPGPAVELHELDRLYGLAVIQFSERLAWVAARESLGVSPSQRRALGLVEFQGLTAKSWLTVFVSPVEVVEYWVREGHLLSESG